jgi:hypothetical protein
MFRCTKNVLIKSTPIIIDKLCESSDKLLSSPTNYSLKKNYFDPEKNSPPNEFMKKLNDRMKTFN